MMFRARLPNETGAVSAKSLERIAPVIRAAGELPTRPRRQRCRRTHHVIGVTSRQITNNVFADVMRGRLIRGGRPAKWQCQLGNSALLGAGEERLVRHSSAQRPAG